MSKSGREGGRKKAHHRGSRPRRSLSTFHPSWGLYIKACWFGYVLTMWLTASETSEAVKQSSGG